MHALYPDGNAEHPSFFSSIGKLLMHQTQKVHYITQAAIGKQTRANTYNAIWANESEQ